MAPREVPAARSQSARPTSAAAAAAAAVAAAAVGRGKLRAAPKRRGGPIVHRLDPQKRSIPHRGYCNLYFIPNTTQHAQRGARAPLCAVGVAQTDDRVAPQNPDPVSPESARALPAHLKSARVSCIKVPCARVSLGYPPIAIHGRGARPPSSLVAGRCAPRAAWRARASGESVTVKP